MTVENKEALTLMEYTTRALELLVDSCDMPRQYSDNELISRCQQNIASTNCTRNLIASKIDDITQEVLFCVGLLSDIGGIEPHGAHCERYYVCLLGFNS
jgi:hypothetical protein